MSIFEYGHEIWASHFILLSPPFVEESSANIWNEF